MRKRNFETGHKSGIYLIIFFSILIIVSTGCTKGETQDDEENIPKGDKTAPTVISVTPANNSLSASVNSSATATFSEIIDDATITTSSFSVKKGNISVPGNVTYSGTIATFTPATTFLSGTMYTATISTSVKDTAGNALSADYTWTFTTAVLTDITPPAVLTVFPLANSTSVSTDTKPAATFSEPMNQSTITSSSFTVKQGSEAVAGSISFSENTVTFTPSSALAPNAVHTINISTAVKDTAGNSLANAYFWSFTTAALADVTPPTILSVLPLSNATAVSTDIKPVVTFSEPINQTTITTSSFTVKQGSAVVAGSLSFSGNTVTFSPSSVLAPNAVYTINISTAVKDVAGNSLANAYSWSFTTVAAVPAGKSFSADVVPILNLCNTCHKHGWTVSSTASTFYTNLVNGGYVNPTSYTTSKIYKKINGGHPSSTVTAAQKNTVLTWMSEGSKNN